LHFLKDIDDLSRSPPGEYSDDYPNSGVNVLPVDKPPYLPPQLLNIVLNKDTSVRVNLFKINTFLRLLRFLSLTHFYIFYFTFFKISVSQLYYQSRIM